VVVVGVGGVGVKGATVVVALWVVPLASVPSRSDRLARLCGGTVDTVNVGSRIPACPPFNIALRERGPTAIQDKCPRLGRGLDWFPNPGDLSKRKRDHIPNTFNLFSSDGRRGKEKIQLLLRYHGQYGHFNLYVIDITWCFHSNDRGGCESLNQLHVREPNFFKDNLRIVENFVGTEGFSLLILASLHNKR
jgi:hypothetical protein